MNTVDIEEIKKLQEVFDIKAIYARHVFEHADKSHLLESAQSIIANKAKPFVKWVGGKRQLLKQLVIKIYFINSK